MASFPSRNLSSDNFKIRFREQFASEVLNKRFVGTPYGVYLGFLPIVAGPLVTLTIQPLYAVSLLRGESVASKTSLDVFFEEDVLLDFTGHDFVASGPIYVVAEISYVRNGTTSARIFTQTGIGNGRTTITICRLEGDGAPGTITAFFTDEVDRNTPMATTSKPFGFMPAGSVETLNTLNDALGKIPYNPTVRSLGFSMAASDVDQIHMLDMGSIVANQAIDLPDSTTLKDGCRVGFLSMTGLPPGFGLTIQVQGTDLVMLGNLPVSFSPVFFKHVGHFYIYTLVKAATTGFPTARWYLTVNTLQELHGADHHVDGADAIPLDKLAAPITATDLDASPAAHGLMPLMNGLVSNVLRMDGTQGPVPPAPGYVIDPVVVVGALPAPTADGRVYLIDHSLAGGVISLPPSGGLTHGVTIRFLNIKNRGIGFNTTLLADGADRFCADNILSTSTTAELSGVKGAFTELTLLTVGVASPVWVKTTRMREEWAVLPPGSTSAEINDVLNDVTKHIVYLLPGEYFLNGNEQILVPNNTSLLGLTHGAAGFGRSSAVYPTFRMVAGIGTRPKIKKVGDGSIGHFQVLIGLGVTLFEQAIVEVNATLGPWPFTPVIDSLTAEPYAKDIHVSCFETGPLQRPRAGILAAGRVEDCTVNHLASPPPSPLPSILNGMVLLGDGDGNSRATNCKASNVVFGFRLYNRAKVESSRADECNRGFEVSGTGNTRQRIEDCHAEDCEIGFSMGFGTTEVTIRDITSYYCGLGLAYIKSSITGVISGVGFFGCTQNTVASGSGPDGLKWAGGAISIVQYIGSNVIPVPRRIALDFVPDSVVFRQDGIPHYSVTRNISKAQPANTNGIFVYGGAVAVINNALDIDGFGGGPTSGSGIDILISGQSGINQHLHHIEVIAFKGHK